MIRVAFLRHAPTAWNRDRLLQGRADPPLLDEARAALAMRRLPTPVDGFAVAVSPLRRAGETAAALGLGRSRTEPRLVEMDYGAFEGRRLDELRAELGDGLATNERRGLDFRPPGGESPREVRERLRDWLAGLRADTLAITHKGVIRCVLTLAYDWDMTGRQPVRLDWSAVHLFAIDGAGNPMPLELNIPLARRQE